ncbi:MAG: sulfatase-like hydrolase/transferase [Candidatus Aminicenantes bacterium]|jgi:arylsulfatase A-like enzyme/Flp pilus assembly protein TadD
MEKRICFFLVSLVFLASFLLSSPGEGSTHTNVLLITIDTLRADRLSCYSDKHIQTPNIDSLAERGVLFTRAFAHTPTTLPSHANILLGTTPLYHGVHENVNFFVPEEHLTLAEYLKAHGYATAAFVGAYPLDSRFGLSQGFDLYDDSYERSHSKNFLDLERRAEAVVENVFRWFETADSPWFVWVHCFDPHTPYNPPGDFKSRFKKNLYNGEVAYVDSVLGTLFELLEERRLWDSTLVVFTGDHGESLGDHGEETHGFFAYNATLWIPLIFVIPGISQARINQPVGHTDIFPTVCETLGFEKPTGLQGISLLPSMKGKKLPERPIYFESLFPYYSHGWAPLRGLIQDEKKFIDSPIPEYYDLEKDFKEKKNLAKKIKIDEYRAQLKKLKQKLSSPGSAMAEAEVKRDVLEKLRSLGYVSGSGPPKTKKFGPKDDIKVLLPYFNKTQKALSLYLDGSADEAEEVLRDILIQRKDLGMAYVYLARILRETGQVKNALNVLLPGMKLLPANYDVFIEYIKTLLASGRTDEAIAAFGKAKFREMDLDPEFWNNLGVCYARKKDYDKAIKAYEQAYSLDNSYPQLLSNLGDVYYSLAIQNHNPEVFQKALDYYQKAVEIDPGYPAPYEGLGDVFFSLGDKGRAITCWEKAVELDPNRGLVYYDLGLAYLEMGNKAKALSYFQLVKKMFYRLLPEEEKKRLNELIKDCS